MLQQPHGVLTVPVAGGLDEQTPYLVTDVVDGDSLEAALREYGPAAIEDLLPRLRAIAEALDEAHAAGRVHGSLHPRNIFVGAESTHVTGLGAEAGAAVEQPAGPPYAAPEVASGGDPVLASDQFALAAITFEWMFGRGISGPARRPVEVRALPDVDRDAMSKAFTRALAPEAADRFASCTAFYHALAAAVVPVLPLGGAEDDADPVEPFLPEEPPVDVKVPAAAEVDQDLSIDEPRFASIEPKLSPPVEPVTSWQPSSAYTRPRPVERFGGGMLIAALLVGMVVGFAAGYMARPRALQSGPPQHMAVPPSGTESAAAPAPVAPGTEAPEAPQAPEAPKAPEAPASIGRLLVRSTPAGAVVEVDGVAKGVTPLALRDLELGSRTITVARRGYIAETRRVQLTRARPSRSLEIRLAAAAIAAPRPGTPATSGRRPAAVSTGTLSVESRPSGAAVTINGKPGGITPVTLDALAPGDYRVTLTLAGYQPFATTVRVVAGERTRAAASLSVQE